MSKVLHRHQKLNMLKHVVVLLALIHFSKAEDTIKEILFHLRDLRDQQHHLTFFQCKTVIAQELLRALDHVKITSHGTHGLQETVRKLQVNIDGLIEGDQSKNVPAEKDCAKEKIMLVKPNNMANSGFIERYIRFFQDWLTYS